VSAATKRIATYVREYQKIFRAEHCALQHSLTNTMHIYDFQFVINNIRIEIYKNTISPGVLEVCETWSVLVTEKQRHGVLRRIFWPKRDEVRGEWRKPNNEDLYNLYSSPNNIRVIK
jgi:hypothetical protein